MSKLLINEPALQVLPTLAKLLGLNEAIALQQVHFRVFMEGRQIGDHRWALRTIPEWLANDFTFFSERTLMRTFDNLKTRGLLLATDEFNRSGSDRSLWYRVDDIALDALLGPANLAGHIETANLAPSIKGSESLEKSSRAPAEDMTPDAVAVKCAFERYVGPCLPAVLIAINAALEAGHSAAWLVEACELAQARFVEGKVKRPSWAYVLGIVESWARDGYDGGAGRYSELEQHQLRQLGIEL